MRFLLFVLVLFLIGWGYGRHEEKIRKQQQQLLGQSKKYNRLCEMSEALRDSHTPIRIYLDSLNEFRMYNKTAALGRAYDKACLKYNFLSGNHFEDRFRAVTALPYSDSDYVRRKEEEAYEIVSEYIGTPVRLVWSYTSPAGRNHYEESAYVTVRDLQEYAQHREAHKHNINQEQYRRERERQMLTPGLRYDILKRDNFRCQICGRSARDGAILEVDHKHPIARGGKTEPNNLWTLCRDCNRGKADKL